MTDCYCSNAWLPINPQVIIVQVFGNGWLLFKCLVTDKPIGGYCSGVWLQTNPQVVLVQMFGYR